MLAPDVIERITEVRVQRPDHFEAVAKCRVRRALAPDGKLVLVAADHPARRVTVVGSDHMAMVDRAEFIGRVVRVLQAPSVDGLMATMDVIEDLLMVDDYLRDRGHAPLLDERVVVPSLNRGGLDGTVWELDDPMTGPSPRRCAELGMDGGKVLVRIADDEPASLRTMRACAKAITKLAKAKLTAFVEPLPVRSHNGRWVVQREPEALARTVSVAQALGSTSSRTWLKLPYCEPFGAVAQATTLPILMLGGDPSEGFGASLIDAMASGSTVRGAMVGRHVLYPGDQDPVVVAEMIGALVHRGCSLEEARHQGHYAAKELDEICSWRPR